MTGVQLGLLKPLWHLYLKLASKHGQSDSAIRPPLMLALTELFLAVEIAAEVRQIIYYRFYYKGVCNCRFYFVLLEILFRLLFNPSLL